MNKGGKADPVYIAYPAPGPAGLLLPSSLSQTFPPATPPSAVFQLCWLASLTSCCLLPIDPELGCWSGCSRDE
jgi:hypothetical protein